MHIREVQRVVELDSGSAGASSPDAVHFGPTTSVDTDAIRSIEQELVIVVPCMNEVRKVVEGVLSGIPHDCLIVLVSNSSRRPVDRYEMEVDTVEQFCRFAERQALAIHQRDPGLAAAIRAAGMPELMDDEGLVRDGKGEAMLIGLVLASLTGRKYVGYIDADNYIPSTVHEYCTAFAAGLHLAGSPFSMVRIAWGSKPKLADGRVFYSRHGRTSEITNRFLNCVVAEHSGFGTDVIATGNSGEHALSIDLALRMRMAGGYAGEPYQIIELFEQYGGVLDPPHPDVMASTVPILQIETRSPHFHADKGEGHVQDMRMQALNALFHSPICLPSVRAAIVDYLVAESMLSPGGMPARERIYPPVGKLAIDLFFDILKAEASTFRQMWRRLPTGVRADPPIRRSALIPSDVDDLRAAEWT